MITDLGTLDLAAVVPWAATAVANIGAACGIAAPNVSGQLTALAGFQPQASLGLAQLLAIAQQILDAINAAIAAVPPVPVVSLSAQAQMAASLAASLNAQLLQLQALLGFGIPSGAVRALVYSGPNNLFGSELAGVLGSSSAACNGLVLVATSPSAWAACQAMFKTTP